MTCLSCGSNDVDMDYRRCNACDTYLPDGSFDVRPKYSRMRAAGRSNRLQQVRAHSDKRSESITGGAS